MNISQKNQSKIHLGLLSASLYVSFQLIANVLSTKIALLPLLNLSVDGGTIIYPLTFTVRDFVHKTWGKVHARQIVIYAALINVLMALLFWLVSMLQPDPTWPNQLAYESILLPVWRITAASIIAQVLSELLDTEIFSRVYKTLGDVMGVIASNSVALIVDSIVFTLIAFAGVLPMETVWQIFIANVLIKGVITLASAPSIKLVPRLVQREDM